MAPGLPPPAALQPLLAAFFEWGVALHDLDFEAIRKGKKSKAQVKRELAGIREKAKSQIVKDYVAWPLLSGLAMAAVDAALEARRRGRRAPAGWRARCAPLRRRGLRAAATANATANVVRNAWAYAIIFCGHFPDQTYTFSPEEVEDESRGGWYVRQLVGAANIEGSPLFHVASGNLGYQVEHHLFPDMPSTRYAEIAPQVKQSASATACPTTAARSGSSSGWCRGRSCGSPSRAAPRAQAGPYRGEREPAL